MIKHRRLGFSILILIMMSLLGSATATASITAVVATNSPSQLAGSGTSFSQVSWTVTENAGFNGGQVMIVSPGGVFRAPNGNVLGSVGQLQQIVNISPNSGSVPVIFSEPLSIPASVISQVQQLGFNNFTYARNFNDGATGPTASVTFVLAIASTQIGQSSVSNIPAQVVITSTSHSQLGWNVNVSGASGSQATVSSSAGFFSAPDGSPLGTVPQLLQATKTLVGTTATFRFNELLMIPQSIARLAQSKGFGSFRYIRQFSAGQSNVTVSATFTITGGGAAGVLSVRRVQMEYDDSRITAVIAPGSEMRAHAIVSYAGTGLLEYSWEVASPPSTMGQPVFVPILSRKQYLLAGDQVVLRSPRLPTDQDGDYLLRLRLHKPGVDFELPVLRYAVNRSAHARTGNQVSVLQVSRPAPDSVLGLKTQFAWQAIAMAKAYQLEIYDRPVRDKTLPSVNQPLPVTGVLVPAAKTQLSIGNMSRTHLLSGNTYYWRVLAISDKGQVVARSAFRRIKFP